MVVERRIVRWKDGRCTAVTSVMERMKSSNECGGEDAEMK